MKNELEHNSAKSPYDTPEFDDFYKQYLISHHINSSHVSSELFDIICLLYDYRLHNKK